MTDSVKLAYVADGVSGIVSLKTKSAARVLDRFLREEYGTTGVYTSKIIYDDDGNDGYV